MVFDFWYCDSLRDVVRATCAFYPGECVYRGNLYNRSGRIVGDYSSRDSVEVEKYFPGIFG